MTEQEITHIKNTVGDGVANKNNDVWIKAFGETYPTLSMDAEWHYMKVLCKLLINS